MGLTLGESVSDRMLRAEESIREGGRQCEHEARGRVSTGEAWSSSERRVQFRSCSCDQCSPCRQVPLAKALAVRGARGVARQVSSRQDAWLVDGACGARPACWRVTSFWTTPDGIQLVSVTTLRLDPLSPWLRSTYTGADRRKWRVGRAKVCGFVRNFGWVRRPGSDNI